MVNIKISVPDNLAKELNYLIELGLYKNESEIVQMAVQKFLAEQSREYLRDLAKDLGIKEKVMISEWKRIRT